MGEGLSSMYHSPLFLFPVLALACLVWFFSSGVGQQGVLSAVASDFHLVDVATSH